MDSDPAAQVLLLATQVNITHLIVANLFILFLLMCSAMMSGSEIAFFSLTPAEVDELSESDNKTDNRIAKLLERPRFLLSTIVITNNLVNIAIVITSYFVTRIIFDLWQLPERLLVLGIDIPRYGIEFLLNVVVSTFVLVLFGEVTPKVFATYNKMKIARFMAGVFIPLSRLLYPLNFILVGSTKFLEKRLKRYHSEIDIGEINRAIEMTVEKRESKQDAKLLKGIVYFGNIVVKQVMRPRTEVAAVNREWNFRELMNYVKEMGYSRFPVYEENLDKVIGILYIKDLMESLGEPETFDWLRLIREPLFVPETKKIDDLMREIQESRKHLAVVVDEFGGTSGIITLEDIIEEVLGDIKDEFDETADGEFKKIDEHNFLFEGKAQLVDVCRLMELDAATFEEARGEAETLGGLVLEIAGRIPKSGELIYFDRFKFTILSVVNNRILKIKVTDEGTLGNNAD